MSYEFRDGQDYLYGALDQPAALNATTLTSSAFVELPTGYSPAANGTYLPLVLQDPVNRQFEIVWVTGHSTGSNTVTVVRGKQGTTARPWGAGSQFESSPTVRDVLPVLLSTALPSDAHFGARVARTDKKDVVEKTLYGWGPSVGAGLASDQHKNMSAVVVPDGAPILLRAGSSPTTYTTSAQGNFSLVYKTPFPNRTLAINVISTAYAANGPFVLFEQRADGCSLTALDSTGNRLVNTVISINYIAFGW
jgi:hypothetical protein